ncbi:GTPase [Oscillatoria sp. CS-180]|uniref:GTP-binding protein n=1 Tax=Oscillatoria sp. CS-180 TaxID=3021720 RepID=UPI00232EF436|nr:GTPase [Oscillatoria sp. CS-180]MDB9527321.1 GTPase [Oscillatoria sp. CS-180]
MEVMRLIIAGAEGSGKSAFIRTISEIEVIGKNHAAQGPTAHSRGNASTSMDFGRLQFGHNMVLHMYGTPGESRFDFMRDMLIRKAHACVLLVPSHRPAEFRRSRLILNYMQQRSEVPIIIGLTHQDSEDAWNAKNIAIALGSFRSQPLPTMIIVNANERQSVAKALIMLISRFSQQRNPASRLRQNYRPMTSRMR